MERQGVLPAGGGAHRGDGKGRPGQPGSALSNLRAAGDSCDRSWPTRLAPLFKAGVLPRLPRCPHSPEAPAPLLGPFRARAAPCPAPGRGAAGRSLFRAPGSSPRAPAALPGPRPPRCRAALQIQAHPARPDASSPPFPLRPSWPDLTPARPPPPRCQSPLAPTGTSGTCPPGLPPRLCPARAHRRGCPPA